ncbi:MAG: hypothetical protein U1F36_19555 [Planctomycetota bacterium]
MSMLRTLTVLTAFFLLGSCTKEAGAAGANPAGVADSITKLLTGITDGKTADAAKSQLETLTTQFSSVVSGLKSAASSEGEKASGAIGDLAKKAMGALTPELTTAFKGITDQITRLMNIQDVTKAIGPVLEKLKGLIPA